MSTMLPPVKPPADWFSMWLGWPFLVYEEWLKLLRPPTPPSEMPAGERFGIAESDQELVLVAEAPEYRSSELGATIDERVVNIRGERHEEAEAGELRVRFDRKITLPPSMNIEEATTSLRDGLVEVHIPKMSEAAELGVKLPNSSSPQEAQEREGDLLADLSAPEPAASPTPKKSRAPRAPSLARRSRPKGAKKQSGRSKHPAKKGKRR